MIKSGRCAGIFLLLFCLSDFAQAPVAGRSRTFFRILAGDYLRKDYLDTLVKTRSPFRSVASDTPQLVSVAIENGRPVLNTVFNFHEGGPEFLTRPDGSIAVKPGYGLKVANPTFIAIDAQHFRLGFDDFAPEVYSFVGNSGRYVADLVLAGEYVDQHSRHYVFAKDGNATFPDRKFRYSVGMDHILNGFDYFQDDTAKKTYGFRRKGDILDITHTSGAVGQNLEKTPFLSLRKCCVGR